jgi:N-acetylmuramoyl-L-alanine amidase
MRLRTILSLAAAGALLAPAGAAADFPHVVASGESLTSVAAADGLTVDQLAAANGISPYTELEAGTTLLIPPQGTGYAPATTEETSTETPAATPETSAATETSATGYVVQPGDTLTAIAARAGTTVAALAAANGLDPSGILLSGSTLQLSGAGASTTEDVSDTTTTSTQPVGATAEGSSGGPPYPTPETVSASEIGSIAQANGVDPSLAEAIGWQESGFNNDLVSVDDARGVMQILPGTWNWIGSSLAGPYPLAPASAESNVRGGVLLLKWLLNNDGGSEATAAAGYYQGLPSVEQDGEYSSTQQYVADVQSLQAQFGGP